LIIGAHVINKGIYSAEVVTRIEQSSGLIVGTGTVYGAGVYAYYADAVPARFADSPMVVFQLPASGRRRWDVREVYIRGLPGVHGSRFFLVPAPIGSTVPVAVLGFLNTSIGRTFMGTLCYL
jgi:hypothetical protein